MCNEDAGSNALQQCNVGGLVVVVGDESAGLELHLRCVEGVEGGITDKAGSGPLGVEGSLGPCVEAVALGSGVVSLNIANGGSCDYVFAGDPGRATTLRRVCEVDCVALIEKVRGPARAIVGCIEEVLGLGINISF